MVCVLFFYFSMVTAGYIYDTTTGVSGISCFSLFLLFFGKLRNGRKNEMEMLFVPQHWILLVYPCLIMNLDR